MNKKFLCVLLIGFLLSGCSSEEEHPPSALWVSRATTSPTRATIRPVESPAPTPTEYIIEEEEPYESPVAIEAPIIMPTERPVERVVAPVYYKRVITPKDAICQIVIPGTVIDYPVMWDVDANDFWLTHTPERTASSLGSIFLDNATGGVIAGVTLINGHNSSSGRRFGGLTQYRRTDFAEIHSQILLYYEEEVVEYRVFSVVVMNADREMLRILFRDTNDKRSYFDAMISRSVSIVGSIENFNSIIALNTCTYEGENYRLIVFASEVGRYALHDEEIP
jgi:sortase B